MQLAKRAIVAGKLHRAQLYLYQYKRCPEINVACDLLMDAERRVRNGFSPVPKQDAANLLAIELQHETA